MELRLEITDCPTAADVQTLVHGLVSYNESKIGPENYVDLNILVRDGENNVWAGCWVIPT